MLKIFINAIIISQVTSISSHPIPSHPISRYLERLQVMNERTLVLPSVRTPTVQVMNGREVRMLDRSVRVHDNGTDLLMCIDAECSSPRKAGRVMLIARPVIRGVRC